MKKILMIALLAVLTVSFYSCKKDKHIDKTSWTYQDQGEKAVLKFINKTDMSLASTFDGQTISFAGTYTYDAPNVKINILDEVIKGTVDGSKMSLTDPDDGSITVFIKD